ncbi:MAG TPA: cupredoxin domain-containing protein [Candidatus Limnocylindria bacterium]|nr:cupredoxin domain-containing protein [Candidatus Limnocylindria bacterium]HET9877851.1 cupredoxin domain-containing protein [Candidatus Limnocylindria bacterium]
MHRSAALIGILALVLAACASPAASPSATEPPTPSATEAATPSASPSAEESESAEPSEEATAEEVRVRLESSNFDPSELTIPAGTTVLFLNADSYTHTVTEGTGGQAVDDPIVDREIAQNRSVRVTFDEPGTYDITCEIHPSMQLTVTVEG